MSEAKDPPVSPPDLFSLMRHHEAQKKAFCEEIKTQVGAVPVTPEVLSKICGLMPDERADVLSQHPGYVLELKLQSLWRMLEVFELAYGDVVAQLDAFHVFSESEQMHTPVERPALNVIERRLNKELVAFSAAAASLVEFSRRLPKGSGMPDMKSQRERCFDAKEHEFVIALRNMISHEIFPDISWQIDFGGEQGRRTDFILSPRGLAALTKLSASALAYIALSPEGVRVRPLVDAYAQRVRDFYAWLRQAYEASELTALQDYRRLVKACKAHASRAAYRFLLPQFLSRKVDPYEHLADYLLPEQFQEAMRFPLRSREQVDYIIQAVDEYGVCDTELRVLVDRLFQIDEHEGKHLA